MAISQIGKIIKRRRLALGLSQEELSDGICAVTTLSRIENGERMPTQNHLEMLLQRLGYSEMMFHSYVDEEEFYAHELKFKIRQAYIENNKADGNILLDEFKALVKNPSNIDKQFILLLEILLNQSNEHGEEYLAKFEDILRLTHPRYKRGNVPQVLTYEEIVLLNNISIEVALLNQQNEAIDILYGIVKFYDMHTVNTEETLRTAPMIFYNLSKQLGLAGRYDECIQICDRGIELAQKTGRCGAFSYTLYNKAWALVKRGRAEDLSDSKKFALQAKNVAEALGHEVLLKCVQDFMDANHMT